MSELSSCLIMSPSAQAWLLRHDAGACSLAYSLMRNVGRRFFERMAGYSLLFS
jgi:hypothetical protein